MRKRIGVFIGEVAADDYSNAVVTALGDIFRQNNMDLFVFGDYGIFEHSLLLYAEGEQSICRLPVLDSFDGIIVDESLFHIDTMADELCERLKQYAKCPVIYIKSVRESFTSILLSDKQAIKDITKHLIEKHGLTDICHLTGRWELQDAHERYEGYYEAMTEAGLTVDDTMIYYGDYWKGKAKPALDYFYSKRGHYPEAIVCANDFMAISVVEELLDRGIKVPEDICVTGYDNVPGSQNHLVPLTTFDADPIIIAQKTYDLFTKLSNNEPVDQINYVQNKMILRKSCGCNTVNDYQADLHRFIKMTERTTTGLNLIFFMNTNFNTSFTEGEIFNKADFYFAYTGALGGAIILTDDAFNSQDRPDDMICEYPDEMILKRVFHSTPKKQYESPNVKFSRKLLIPEEYRPDKPCVFYVHSIHAQNKVYGYMVSMFNRSECPNRFYQAYLGCFATAIENYNIRNKYLDAEELRQAYMADALTGIFNRRGFENNLNILSERAARRDLYLSIVCLDMDDLKFINDNYGHQEGDIALKSIAEALSSTLEEDEICARYGGDEFAALLLSEDPIRHKRFETDFEKAIATINKELNKKYNIHASYGIVCVKEHPGMQVNVCMSMADAIMYRNKKAYKKEHGSAPR